MNNPDTASLDQFPIAGPTVCEALLGVLEVQQRLILRDIETLCSSECEGLGDLWKKTVVSRSEVVTVGELVTALKNADQVICLDLAVEANPDRSFLIEDGELVENNLQQGQL